MLESYIFDSSVSHQSEVGSLRRYLDIEVTEFADIVSKDSRNQSFSQVQIEVATRYAAEDADVSLRLHKKLFSNIRKTGRLESLLAKVEVPLVQFFPIWSALGCTLMPICFLARVNI